ncbi:MAG: GDSL family lipase [Oscillospiraceae bacterium]|nr:GDSL family lipase [Oscillospiraceae bacterium]
MCPSLSSEADSAPLPRPKLYCLGDSLTFGYGVSPRERWLTLASERSGWQLMNRGVCGDTTGGMLVRLRELLTAVRKPQAVMLMGGANDIFYSGSEQGARANMGAMIQQLLTAGVLPLAAIPMPIVPDWHPEEWGAVVDFRQADTLLKRYGDWLAAYCRVFHVKTVDFRPLFLDEEGSIRRDLYLDGLHPNPEGHRQMAALLSGLLQEWEAELSR